jgi:hypothetical protein
LADEGCFVFGKVVRVDGVIVAELRYQLGTGRVSRVLQGSRPTCQCTYLAVTIAWMHVLSSMTPTWVVSSRDTTGTLNALGRRARQFDLFWSSNV